MIGGKSLGRAGHEGVEEGHRCVTAVLIAHREGIPWRWGWVGSLGVGWLVVSWLMGGLVGGWVGWW